LALLGTVALIAALVLTGLFGGGPTRAWTALSHRRKAATQLALAQRSGPPAAGPAAPARAAPPTPVSPAVTLESQGHALLQDGRYAGAVQVLRHAVLATGERTDLCIQPASATCLTYAYALYDLGRALRLSGDQPPLCRCSRLAFRLTTSARQSPPSSSWRASRRASL